MDSTRSTDPASVEERLAGYNLCGLERSTDPALVEERLAGYNLCGLDALHRPCAGGGTIGRLRVVRKGEPLHRPRAV